MSNKSFAASAVAMVRPAAFCFNPETAINNFFQNRQFENNLNLQNLVLHEFDEMVLLLRENGIDVLVLTDTQTPVKPDAIFPNNWFTCSNNLITLYPMYAKNRRPEITEEHVAEIMSFTGITKIEDFRKIGTTDEYLEGTGSMVIDHKHRIAYACRSERTNELLFRKYCSNNGFEAVLFNAIDERGKIIYHTNVMMCIGAEACIICTDAIAEADRDRVMRSLKIDNRRIISISPGQMNSFAGNMLQLKNKSGELLMVMSKSAYDSLEEMQIVDIERSSRIIVADVSMIEQAAGGSVRCMMAELVS